MASRYSRGSSRLSRIASAPTYGASLSRYSAQLRSAITDMDKAAVDQAVLSFKQGGMTFDQFKQFMSDKISSLPSGSLVQVDAQNALVDATKFQHDQEIQTARATLQAQAADSGVTPQERANIENKILQLETPGTQAYTQQQDKAIQAFENWQTQKVMDKRNELIQKYTAGGKGLTTQNELSIIQELKKIADPQSKVFNQLVDQEQSLKARVGTEQAAQGKVGSMNDARDKLSQISSSERDAEMEYQQGNISGLTRDQAKLQNAQEAFAILQNLAKQGISVPEAQLTAAQNAFSDAQKTLQLRQTGQMFDVVDNKGKVISVTPSGLTMQTNPNTGRTELVKADYENFNVKFNPTSQSWQVLDANGNVLADNLPSQGAAQNVAKQQGAYTINAVMTGADGRTTTKELSRDAKTGAFYNPKNPSEVYTHIPQSGQDFNNATLKNVPANWLTDPNAANFVKNYVSGQNSGLPNTGNNTYSTDQGSQGQGQGQGNSNNPVGVTAGGIDLFNPTVAAQRRDELGKTVSNIGSSIGSGIQSLFNPTAGNPNGISAGGVDLYNPDVAAQRRQDAGNAIGSAFNSVKADLGPVFNGLSSTVSNIGSGIGQGFNDFEKNLSGIGSGIGSALSNFSLPDFKLPDLPSLPDFKLPDFNFSFPSFGSSSSSGSSSNNNSGPNFDFFGGIQRLGSDIGSAASNVGSFLGNAFNSAKSFLGF